MGGWGSTTDKEIDVKLWKCPMFSSRHPQVGYLVLLGRNWPEGEFKNVSQSPVAQVSMWICQKYSCIKYFPQNILQNMCSQTDITFFLTAASLYARILVFMVNLKLTDRYCNCEVFIFGFLALLLSLNLNLRLEKECSLYEVDEDACYRQQICSSSLMSVKTITNTLPLQIQLQLWQGVCWETDWLLLPVNTDTDHLHLTLIILQKLQHHHDYDPLPWHGEGKEW